MHGFDHDHSALIMTIRACDAKRFGSRREAELWVNRYGKDLESYRILVGEQGEPAASRSTQWAAESWGLDGS